MQMLFVIFLRIHISKRFRSDSLNYQRVDKVTCSQKQSGRYHFNRRGDFEVLIERVYIKLKEKREGDWPFKKSLSVCHIFV